MSKEYYTTTEYELSRIADAVEALVEVIKAQVPPTVTISTERTDNLEPEWIPAPGDGLDLIPDGAEVRQVIYGVRRTSDEPLRVVGQEVSEFPRYTSAYIDDTPELKARGTIHFRVVDHG